ncbi:Aamy domain-containing protein, partial [Haematococcus lacustris]
PRAAVRDAENLQASTPRPGDRHLGIYKVDPDLKAHSEHLNYRWQQYTKTKDAIVQAEGSLAAFAQGHKKMGIVREGGVTTVREWAPAAQAVSLIGDFSGWKEVGMKKDQWGVWEVALPDVQGQPAIPHRSRIKVKLQAPGGWWVDRLSAWIRWATVEPGVMGAKYDGIHWDPPPAEAYKWRSERPYKPRSLRIYEAHVGMSSEEGKVASYTEFKNLVLPHIKAAGYTAVQLMAIQEHAYYGSFGYHVTNPFAVSSRSGTPDELKAIVIAEDVSGMPSLCRPVQEGGLGFDYRLGMAIPDKWIDL